MCLPDSETRRMLRKHDWLNELEDFLNMHKLQEKNQKQLRDFFVFQAALIRRFLKPFDEIDKPKQAERRKTDRRIGGGGMSGRPAGVPDRRKTYRRCLPNVRNCTFVTDGATEAATFVVPDAQRLTKERRKVDRRSAFKVASIDYVERRMADRRKND